MCPQARNSNRDYLMRKNVLIYILISFKTNRYGFKTHLDIKKQFYLIQNNIITVFKPLLFKNTFYTSPAVTRPL